MVSITHKIGYKQIQHLPINKIVKLNEPRNDKCLIKKLWRAFSQD